MIAERGGPGEATPRVANDPAAGKINSHIRAIVSHPQAPRDRVYLLTLQPSGADDIRGLRAVLKRLLRRGWRCVSIEEAWR
jgi:hypothetical protein